MFVNAHKAGQLANCLLHGAHLLAAGRAHGHAVLNPGLLGYARYFETTQGDLLCRHPARPSRLPHGAWARRALYRLVRLSIPALHRLPFLGRWVRAVVWRDPEVVYRLDTPAFAALARSSRLVLFEGWAFRTAAVEEHAEEIRRYFTPIAEHRQRVASLLAALRPRCELLLGVHIRRGDYAGHLGGRYFWEVEEYAAIMRRMQAAFPGRRLLFLVCSNEPLDAARFPGLPVAFGTGHLVEDLYAFAGCDYLVGPPSTYTLWASFHGGVPLRQLQTPGEAIDPAGFGVAHL